MDVTDSFCPECGATIPEGGTCRDRFHALLLLEAEIPGGPGELPHFYAVASYGLQHPGSKSYTAAVAEGLRSAVADMLDGRASLEDIRRRTRATLDGPARVTRRPGDPDVDWYRGVWPLTVTDVLAAGPDGHAVTVERWARSVRETLDAQMG
jgi:hypothetical protein